MLSHIICYLLADVIAILISGRFIHFIHVWQMLEATMADGIAIYLLLFIFKDDVIAICLSGRC